MMGSLYNYLLCSVIVKLALTTVFAVSVDEDIALTRDQKLALDKFRAEVRHLLPEKYMEEQIYLIRWLRVKNFNLAEAKKMLLENLHWRNVNNMSTIQNEDWSDFQEDFPYQIIFDKSERPVVILKFGEWNLRDAVLSNRGQKLTRYLYKALDEVTGKVRSLQEKGKLVTQWVSLLDMDGYSLVTHGCISCLQVYISYVTAYEAYFPGSIHDIILINTPSIFELVLRITSPLLRQSTRNSLHVFGTNKRQWQSYLLQHIDANQLEPNFGGTKL